MMLLIAVLVHGVGPQLGGCALRGPGAHLEGGGCCNWAGPECDYFLYTKSNWCSGACPVNTTCKPSLIYTEPTYWYQDCNGSCLDCETVEMNYIQSENPAECYCGSVG